MATSATTAGGTGSGGLTAGPLGGGTSMGRKKDGGPSTKFWESSETISQLETVRLWIGKHYKKVVSMVAARFSIDSYEGRSLLVQWSAIHVSSSHSRFMKSGT